MKEPIDIIESDPFDPEVVRIAEDVRYETQAELEDELGRYVRRRHEAYARVFGDRNNPDVLIVLQDLAGFCRAYEPTFDDNQKRQDLKEGRREVYYRIADFTRLDHDTLYVKYTVAKNQLKER